MIDDRCITVLPLIRFVFVAHLNPYAVTVFVLYTNVFKALTGFLWFFFSQNLLLKHQLSDEKERADFAIL